MLTVFTMPIKGSSSEHNREKMTTRVVLADDHIVVRQGLRRLLEKAPEIEVVGEAGDGLEAIETVEALQPDVLLLDIEMPVMDGIEVARRLKEAQVDVRILVLSAYDDREYIRALLDIGVSGFLVKGEAAGRIVDAVRGVAKGQKGWVSHQVKRKLEKIHDPARKQSTLTFRDLEMLRLLAMGKTEAELAVELKIDPREVDFLVDSMLMKLGAENKETAVQMALSEGWIS